MSTLDIGSLLSWLRALKAAIRAAAGPDCGGYQGDQYTDLTPVVVVAYLAVSGLTRRPVYEQQTVGFVIIGRYI